MRAINQDISKHLNAAAILIFRQLLAAGYTCYLVGGSLRDVLLGLPLHDYDFTTSAKPEEVERVFQNYRVIETGIKHGTVTVLIDGQTYEITTYRLETVYSDHRHPDSITFASGLEEDLARRDFTVNALAWSPTSGLVDLYDGLADLEKRLIRAVNVPEQRFQEDALRILRALRFAAVLRFDIAPTTAAAIRKMLPDLAYVSTERVTTELDKLFNGAAAVKVLLAYPDLVNYSCPQLNLPPTEKLLPACTSKVLREFRCQHDNRPLIARHLAEMAAYQSAGLRVLRDCFVDKQADPDKVEENWRNYQQEMLTTFAWATFLRTPAANALSAKEIARILCFSNLRRHFLGICLEILTPEKLQTISKAVNVSDVNEQTATYPWGQMLLEYGVETVTVGLLFALTLVVVPDSCLKSWQNYLQTHTCWSLKDLQFNGADLRKNRPELQGAEINKALKQLHAAVLEGLVLNDKEALTAYVLKRL